MKWRILIVVVTLALCGWAFSQEHEHGHDEHEHGGPPPPSWTITSLILTAGGAVLVSLTLLAILWKPIDAAFRLSRFRGRWEKRSTRVGFAVGVGLIVGIGVATAAFLTSRSHDHAYEPGESATLQPQHGGQIQTVDRFATELLLRRTGEIRLYFNVLTGDVPTSWDIKAEVRPLQGFFSGTPTNAIPMKLNSDSTYFVTVVPPPQERQAGVHLTLRVRQQSFDLDFALPVRD